MNVIAILLWVVGTVISILAIYQTVGCHLMVSYFPEGKRWWIFPSQLVALSVFAAFMAFHPFGGLL